MKKPISLSSQIVSFRSLCVESDKGCVIIIASVLEHELRQLHEAHIAMAIHPSKKNVFSDLCRVHAPLSSFAGCIQLGHAYGLISKHDCDDLHVIRKLRNEAAHTLFDFSLQDKGVKAVLNQLKSTMRSEQANTSSAKQDRRKNSSRLPQLTEEKSI
jgi:hypothetical protein